MAENSALTLPDEEPVLRTIAMPADTNSSGDIFGGWLLSQMDLAGGSLAIRRASGRVATVGVESMSFHKPVFVGDEVTCYARLLKVGKTSITVEVEAWVRRARGDQVAHVTDGTFSYVALDEEGNPRPVE